MCKLVHLARTTPPSLSYDSLQLFDEELRRCFSTCIAVDISDNHWQQAQVSLSFGGLGFDLYLIAHMLLSSPLWLPPHLVSAISKLNARVSPSEVISVESALSSPLSQHAVSMNLDDHLFQSMLMASTPANKARLLSTSATHTSSWLSVVPSVGLGLHLDPAEFKLQ